MQSTMQTDGFGKRLLMRELQEINKSSVCDYIVSTADNLYHWLVTIPGPVGTPYESALLNMEMTFAPDFPNSPPTVVFTTAMFHPNIYTDGRVCMSTLHVRTKFNEHESDDELWRPIISCHSLIMSIISLLTDPNTDSPANIEASLLLKTDPAAYKKLIRRLLQG